MGKVRAAQVQDAAAIGEILREIHWVPFLAEASPEEIVARVAAGLARCGEGGSHTTLVYEDEEAGVVGYVNVHWLPYLMLEGPEGFVSELFVRAAQRGKGIGNALLDEVERIAREKGAFRLGLLNGRESEAYARRFYDKAGWTEREQLANFVLPLVGDRGQGD